MKIEPTTACPLNFYLCSVKNGEKTELYLIRHGETEWNLTKRYQGQDNSPLTEAGKEQARLLGKMLSETSFDAMISSDLGRAMQTALIINEYLHLPEIIREPLLRERNFGLFHGMNRKEVMAKYPQEAARLFGGDIDTAPPGGESIRQVWERAVRFLKELPLCYKGKRILAISHGGVVNMIIREVLHIPFDVPRRFKLPNTGLNILTYEKEEWYLRSMGILSHFDDSTIYDDTI